jgi:hypothetical protein
LLSPFVAAHPLVDADSFVGFIARLSSGRFLDEYGSHEGLLRRMDRVLIRFGQRPLEPAEHAAVIEVFHRHALATGVQLTEFVGALRTEAREWTTPVPRSAPGMPPLQPGFAS